MSSLPYWHVPPVQAAASQANNWFEQEAAVLFVRAPLQPPPVSVIGSSLSLSARRWCVLCVLRYEYWVIACCITGMLGFVGSFTAIASGWMQISDYLVAVAISVSFYTVSLMIGYFGDPSQVIPRGDDSLRSAGDESTQGVTDTRRPKVK